MTDLNGTPVSWRRRCAGYGIGGCREAGRNEVRENLANRCWVALLCLGSDSSYPGRDDGDEQHNDGQDDQGRGNRSSEEHGKITPGHLKRLAQSRFGLSAQHERNDHGGQWEVPDPEDVPQDSKTDGYPYIERVVARSE